MDENYAHFLERNGLALNFQDGSWEVRRRSGTPSILFEGVVLGVGAGPESAVEMAMRSMGEAWSTAARNASTRCENCANWGEPLNYVDDAKLVAVCADVPIAGVYIQDARGFITRDGVKFYTRSDFGCCRFRPDPVT